MERLMRTPKIQLIAFLTILYVSVLIYKRDIRELPYGLITIVLTVFFDVLFLKIRRINLFFPSAAIATGLILALINPPSSWAFTMIAPLFAMFSKNFLRFNNRHILNPAGFGVFTAGFFLHVNVSWWAVSFQQLSFSPLSIMMFGILLLPGIVSIFRMKRYPTIIAFIILYSIGHLLFNLPYSIIDPTIIFFSLVMLPEPMTTPHKLKHQLMFGCFVGLIAFLFSLSQLSIGSLLPDILISSLLLGNLLLFSYQ